jgi:hypothetical protein
LERDRDGERMAAPGREEGLTWANPATRDALILSLPDGLPATLRGRLEYRIAWTGAGAPGTRGPVSLSLYADGSVHPVEVLSESQTRIAFRADDAPPGSRLVVHAVDPVFVVGTSPEMLRLQTGTGHAGLSVLTLLLLGFGGALLCACTVLVFRARTTAPTAVMAGLLLLASLTLLPGLVPSDAMARHRRAAMDAAEATSRMPAAADLLHHVPRLYPEEPFAEISAGRVVPARAAADGALRALIGLVLLVPGAWLFTRRNIT